MKAGFWHSVGIVQVNVPEPLKAKVALLCVKVGHCAYGDIIRQVEIGVKILYRAASVEDRYDTVYPVVDHIKVISVSLLRVANHVTAKNHIEQVQVFLDKLRVLPDVYFLSVLKGRKGAIV